MTIIPAPIQKPFRRFEIAAGLLFVFVGFWALLQLILWLSGGENSLVLDSAWEVLLLVAELLLLLWVGGSLVGSGYVPMFFWLLAIYVVINILVTARVFG